MDILETIRSAKACRSFRNEPITQDDVKFLVTYARHAGSGHNRQPWTFIALEDKDRIDTLASFGDYTSPLQAAPVGLVIVVDRAEIDRRDEHNVLDCGRAAQNLQLAATHRGLGICPQGISNRTEAATLLNVPDEKRVLIGFAVGYPSSDPDDTIEGVSKAEELESLGRNPVDEHLFWESHP